MQTFSNFHLAPLLRAVEGRLWPGLASAIACGLLLAGCASTSASSPGSQSHAAAPNHGNPRPFGLNDAAPVGSGTVGQGQARAESEAEANGTGEPTQPAATRPDLATLEGYLTEQVTYPANRQQVLDSWNASETFSDSEKAWLGAQLPAGEYNSASEVITAMGL